VLAFKAYCTRVFNPQFNYYIPTQEELRSAHKHAAHSDSSGNRLSKRFGHPALHQELFTPMVHASMTDLLPEVYRGKIGNTRTKLDEYGGTKVDASVVAGIKIAAIEQVRFRVEQTAARLIEMFYLARSGVRSSALSSGSWRT
jgi:calcium permeable stress-gated cation channel